MSFKSHAAIARKWAVGSLAGSLQKSRDTLMVVGGGASNTLQKVRNTSGKNLHKLRTTSHEAAVATNGKIKQLSRQVSAAAKHAVAPAQNAQAAVVGLGKIVADQPRRRREARRAKENEVRQLLVDSHDAVVLTDVKKRLVAANPAALNLLGVSEFNLKNFTIDAFLAQNLLPEFAGKGSTFRSDTERRSQCKIRRLDGCLQVAECVFVAHALPHQHLYKFLNAVPYRIAPPEFGARSAAVSTSSAAEDHGNSVEKGSKADSKSNPS